MQKADVSLSTGDLRRRVQAVNAGAPGASAQLVFDATGRYVRVILCNGSPLMSMTMGTTIRQWVEKLPIEQSGP